MSKSLVKCLNSNGGIELELITGNIQIEVPGNYVLATGCGSGKTSAIIDLIKEKKDTGIVYSAKTIDECITMYEYLCDNGLKDDIIMLHSCSDDNCTYVNSPEYIRRYKVVICTHHKLMNTPSELLLTYSTSDEEIPPHMRYWHSPVTVRMRKYILIDEMIEKPGFTTMVHKSLIASLQMAVNTGIIRRSKYGYNYGDMLKWYHEYSSVLKSDPLRIIDQYKAEYTLSLIAEHLDEYVSKLSDESDRIEVSYTLLDLLPGRKMEDFTEGFPYFMIFDGTGDIYYKDSRELQVLTTSERYKSKIKIHEKLPFKINRYEENDYHEVITQLEVTSDDLSRIIKEHHRTLIVTWMNIKGDITLESKGREFNSVNFDYVTELQKNLKVYELPENSYQIIHYQSGDDRATNVYNDCDAICFIGMHKVHSVAIMKSNKYNRTRITQLDYQAQMIVQAICRTQIRMHDATKVTDVYFSEDWSEQLVNYVDYYINENLSIYEIQNRMRDNGWLNQIQPRFRDRIILLNEFFNDAIKNQVNTDYDHREEMDLYIKKHELTNMIPLDGSISHFDPLLMYLNLWRIRLTIGIPETKFIKVSKDGKLLPFTIFQSEIQEYLNQGYKIETKFKQYYI